MSHCQGLEDRPLPLGFSPSSSGSSAWACPPQADTCSPLLAGRDLKPEQQSEGGCAAEQMGGCHLLSAALGKFVNLTCPTCKVGTIPTSASL